MMRLAVVIALVAAVSAKKVPSDGVIYTKAGISKYQPYVARFHDTAIGVENYYCIVPNDAVTAPTGNDLWGALTSADNVKRSGPQENLGLYSGRSVVRRCLRKGKCKVKCNAGAADPTVAAHAYGYNTLVGRLTAKCTPYGWRFSRCKAFNKNKEFNSEVTGSLGRYN